MEFVAEIEKTSIKDIQTKLANGRKKLYLETYGCQMNVYDSELVTSIMQGLEYDLVDHYENADAIFLNTCAIRENAEQRVWGQLGHFKQLKEQKPELIIGVLGCMAKHLEGAIHKKRPYVDLVLGPDSYRQIPSLLKKDEPLIQIRSPKDDQEFPLQEYRDFNLNGYQMDTRLSRTEVYEDISPARNSGNTAWIAIMRGCDNFCTFCVVPFTRGRERSRSVESVLEEAKKAVDQGFKEIGLLGQNVNSYRDQGKDFTYLMDKVSGIAGIKRIRFTSPHPKDFPESLLHLIAERENICKQIHMPLQSGSNRILDLMNRTYTREEFLDLIKRTREIIPNVAISTDVISGFPGETEEDHRDTMAVFRQAKFESAFMFKYSARIGTKAYLMKDDVSEEAKSRRLQEIIDLQKEITAENIKYQMNTIQEIVIEGESRRSKELFYGTTDRAQSVVVPKGNLQIGDFARVRISKIEGHALFGEIVNAF